MTNFFNREIFLYSLGDITFQKPVSMKKAAYILGCCVVWTIPLVLIFGLQVRPYPLMMYFGPPIIVGYIADKNIFGGKSLIGFIRTMFAFLQQPKGWTDLRNNSDMGKDVYYTESTIQISRRRELHELEKIEKMEREHEEEELFV